MSESTKLDDAKEHLRQIRDLAESFVTIANDLDCDPTAPCMDGSLEPLLDAIAAYLEWRLVEELAYRGESGELPRYEA